jgi:hypothetical protein
MLEFAFEKLEVHDVVVWDRSPRPAIFAFDHGLLAIVVLIDFEGPDTSAKALSDAAVVGT